MAFFEQRAQHDRRVVWAVGGGAALVGAILGSLLFMEVNRHAPDGWGWSAGWAAWLMQADTVQAGYKLIGRNDPSIIAVVGEDIRLGNAYADELHKCEAAAAQTGKEQRCALDVSPPPRQVNGQPVGQIATCHMAASNGPSGESTGLSDTPRLTVITQRRSLRFVFIYCAVLLSGH